PISMNSLPIGDYGLLSDCRSAALVSRAGSVDWLCFPRFDAPAVFARILDPGGGHFTIRPARDFAASRAYLDQTMALETTFQPARAGLAASWPSWLARSTPARGKRGARAARARSAAYSGRFSARDISRSASFWPVTSGAAGCSGPSLAGGRC